MIFSSRTEWDTHPNRLMRIREQKSRKGVFFLDLTETNPTSVGFQHDSRLIRQAVSHPDILTYRPHPKGSRETRDAVSVYYRDHGREVDPDQILLTASTSEAYGFLFKLLCNPGEEILVPRPSYPLFDLLAGWESVGIRHYPLRYSGTSGWRLDPEKLYDAVSSRCRAVIAVNPNNPTGSYLTVQERKILGELCRQFSMVLICDEVFLDFSASHSGSAPVSTAGDDGLTTFTLSGLSKICGLPQLKLGWIAVNGPSHDVARVMDRLETIADTYLSVSASAQSAAISLLAGRHPFQEQVRARIRENERVVSSWFPPETGAGLRRREGGWMGILQIPKDVSDEELACRLLAEENVLVHPGYFYDMEETPVSLVVSLITRPEIFREGVRRLAEKTRQFF